MGYYPLPAQYSPTRLTGSSRSGRWQPPLPAAAAGAMLMFRKIGKIVHMAFRSYGLIAPGANGSNWDNAV
jgi:hypothetical protein